MKVRNLIVAAVAASLVPALAVAELAKVETKSQFVQLVQGKTLSRPFVRLEVSPSGNIRGMGARWEVEGNWSWQNGYFCREIFWGGDPLGYNCQEVRANGSRIRFTSDRGAGDSADFRLR